MHISPADFEINTLSPAQLEQSVWCLINLREKLITRRRNFDDAIVNTCIDLLFRELHETGGQGSAQLTEKIDEVLLKNISL